MRLLKLAISYRFSNPVPELFLLLLRDSLSESALSDFFLRLKFYQIHPLWHIYSIRSCFVRRPPCIPEDRKCNNGEFIVSLCGL